MLDEWALQFRAWKKRIFAAMLERANLNRAACLHALCAEEAASMRRYGLRNPIAVVPNGIRLSDYDNLPAPGGMEKRFPGLAGRRRLLFLSRVHPKKGLPHLLRAWSRVGAEFPDWILVIVGPDQEGHTDELKGLVRERGLESAVAFVGPVYGRAKQEALADAHGFVLPSFSEGFGIAVLEAMASRLPVLVTPACHFPDVEIDGAGFIRNPDPDDLAEGLRSLMAMTDSDRREMGERGRKCAETRFSATAVSARMLEVYRWLAGESARPDCVRED
jgi:poly(glycerol-phosphate) alpha-glucosyltransferase